MYVLVDADTACYAAAAMAEHDGEGIARSNLNLFLESLLQKLNNPEHEFWITGSGNFRHAVYPEYKANRLKTPRPKYLQVCREHILREHGAHISDGCEADDMLGIGQIQMQEQGIECMISSIDKDLLMIPGWHYIPELKRKGVILREAERRLVSPLEGLKFFYTQLLTGDSTDNIKGVDGIGKVGAKKLLDQCDSEQSLFSTVREAYGCDEELEMNARCLWIQRYPNEDITERWKELFGYEKQSS